MEDDLQEWRIRYSKDCTIVQYTFDCHAEGSDAASEWHFCDDCEAHPSAPPEDAEKHGRCDTEELRLGEQGLDSAKAAAGTILRQTGSMSQADWEQLSIWQTRNRSGAIDTSQRMELPIAPTTGTTSVVDHDVIVITDSDSDDSD